MAHLYQRLIAFLLLIILAINSYANSGVGTAVTGPRAASVGGAALSLSDAWSVFNNPAMLARLSSPVVAVGYENRFLLKELGFRMIAGSIPAKPGNFGFAVKQFGTSLYNETFAGIAFGRSLTPNVSAGLRLDIYRIGLGDNYGHRTTASFAAAIGVQITEDLTFATAIYNPVRIRVTRDFDEFLPSIIRAGFAYRVEQNLLLMAEAEKNIHNNPVLRFGIEYELLRMSWLRAGISTNPLTHSFGFGIKVSSFLVDIAAVRHETLGYTPHLGIIWQPKQ